MTDILQKVEIFRSLNREELEMIRQISEVLVYPKGKYLFKEHTDRDELFVIESGEIELFKTTAYGEEKRLAVFGKYDFLGEGAILDDYPHSTSARALKESKIMKIGRKSISGLFSSHPEIAGKMLAGITRVIGRRMRQTSSRVVNIATQYISGRTRTEHDLLGEREVPYEFYYGIQTLRATENFNISGITLGHFPILIESMAMVKMASAMANRDLKLLPEKLAGAIIKACDQIIKGKFHTHFVVDMIQGGAGTSTNMNANEVIANRALEILGYEKGEYKHCHPNNHVNLSQSTNDVYPTALKIALIRSNKRLTDLLIELVAAFRNKAMEFSDVLKMGRTQLQDAVPMTLGQEFEAYAATLEEEIERLEQNVNLFREVNLGGTAIGTGINADPEYSARAIGWLKEISGIPIVKAINLVESTQDTGAFVMYSSALKRLAVKLSKIANDLRLLSSGPRAGINEINLPKMQPGSSIMPGKVNPVIPEVVNQVSFKVIGNDLTITMAAEAGQLELNVMEPVIAQSLFESIEMLKNGINTFIHRCIKGITVNKDRCRNLVETSIGLVTALVPTLGYEVCSNLAREALENDKGVYELVLEKNLLSREELDRLLSPEGMTHPGSIKKTT